MRTTLADMSKGSSSKKKKKTSPKIPRTPQGQGQGKQPQAEEEEDQQRQSNDLAPTSLEALLLGMEGRLGSKIDVTNKKVNRALNLVAETNTAFEDLEFKVAASEEAFEDKQGRTEERILAQVQNQVKMMVRAQLKTAGFDPEPTASGLTAMNGSSAPQSTSRYYLAVASAAPNCSDRTIVPLRSNEERQEDKFWEGRTSL